MKLRSPLFIMALVAAPAAFGQSAPSPAAGRGAGAGQAPRLSWDTFKWQSSSPPAAMIPNAAKHPTVLLWPQGAPGSEGKTGDEKHATLEGSEDLLIISGVNRPSITVYLPEKRKATGAAVIVAPGGGFFALWITNEGYREADFLSQRGIAAFVLKYRLPNERGSTYTLEGDSLADIQRAIRLVRSRAAEWGVDPDRVGVMGFSAGGMLAGLAGARYNDPVKHPVDSIDKLSAKPAFMALIYGTPFGSPQPMRLDVKIGKDLPPVFLAGGGDDPISNSYPQVYQELKEAGVPAELHMYAGVGHGFGIQGSNPPSVAKWPEQLLDWLFDRGLLK